MGTWFLGLSTRVRSDHLRGMWVDMNSELVHLDVVRLEMRLKMTRVIFGAGFALVYGVSLIPPSFFG